MAADAPLHHHRGAHRLTDHQATDAAHPHHGGRDRGPGIEAWRAGATVVHVHVRDPETGLGTQDVAVFREVVDRLRSETDAILCLTTSGIPGRNLPSKSGWRRWTCDRRWRRSTPARSTPKPASFSTRDFLDARPPLPASTASS